MLAQIPLMFGSDGQFWLEFGCSKSAISPQGQLWESTGLVKIAQVTKDDATVVGQTSDSVVFHTISKFRDLQGFPGVTCSRGRPSLGVPLREPSCGAKPAGPGFRSSPHLDTMSQRGSR